MPQEDSEKKCIKCSVLITDINKVKRRRIWRKCARLECKEYKQKNKTHISEYNQKYKKEHQTY